MRFPSSVDYDKMLCEAVVEAKERFFHDYFTYIPKGWSIELGDPYCYFIDVRNRLRKIGIPEDVVNEYYGGDSRIESDAMIVYLNIGDDERIPMFIGEDKKQGTNDIRESKGLKRQGIGNAIERFLKNYHIFGDYCSTFDDDFFPYTMFCHGCDFEPDSKSFNFIKSKLKPSFGKLNTFNPYFDNNFKKGFHGGTCYCSKEDFSHDDLVKKVYICLQTAFEHYMKKYKKV